MLERTEENTDSEEFLRLKYMFNVEESDLCFTIASLILFVADIVTDVRAAYEYFINGKNIFGALTVTFVLLPTIFNLIYFWYINILLVILLEVLIF